MDALTKSSVDSLLEKIRHLASRPVPEFNRFEALDLLEALKNAAQDTKHEKAGYFRLAFETLRGKADEPNDQFRNFLLPLLGDKDQEKVLEVVAKVQKNNRRKSVRQNSGPGRRAMAAPYMGVRCYYCNRPGHIQISCFKRKRDLGGPSGFSRGAPQPNVHANQSKYRDNCVKSEQFIISPQFHCATYDGLLVIMIRMLEINDFLCIE